MSIPIPYARHRQQSTHLYATTKLYAPLNASGQSPLTRKDGSNGYNTYGLHCRKRHFHGRGCILRQLRCWSFLSGNVAPGIASSHPDRQRHKQGRITGGLYQEQKWGSDTKVWMQDRIQRHRTENAYAVSDQIFHVFDYRLQSDVTRQSHKPSNSYRMVI